MTPVTIADGAVPLCMWQFERMFATARLPGRECDEIRHWDAAAVRHVAVTCKGSFYKLSVYRADGRPRPPDELEAALAALRRDAAARAPSEAEAGIPALTADDRSIWADARAAHFLDGTTNRRSLAAIESALFFVALSDERFDMLDWTARGKSLLVGGGGGGGAGARPHTWFDKSFSLVVFADGKAGLNCEHAWADAPTPSHMFEVALVGSELLRDSYDADGHARPSAGARAATAAADDVWTPLTWTLSRAAEAAIAGSVARLRALSDDLDLAVVPYTKYGRWRERAWRAGWAARARAISCARRHRRCRRTTPPQARTL